LTIPCNAWCITVHICAEATAAYSEGMAAA